MRVTSGLSLLGIALFTRDLLPGVSGSVIGPRNDAQVLIHYEKAGKCFGYVKEADYDFKKAQAPCSKWCKNKGSKSAECPQPWMLGGSTPGSKIKDDKGGEFVPSTCKCGHDLEIAKIILEDTLEGLVDLDKFLCTVALTAVQEIVEVGIQFVPGPNAAGAVIKTVRAAKTFAENGLDAASFFGDWIGPACGAPEYKFRIEDAFSSLTQMPDELGRGQGCKQRRFKSACTAKTPQPGPGHAKKPKGHPEPVFTPERKKPTPVPKKPVLKSSPRKPAAKPSPSKPAPRPSPQTTKRLQTRRLPAMAQTATWPSAQEAAR